MDVDRDVSNIWLDGLYLFDFDDFRYKHPYVRPFVRSRIIAHAAAEPCVSRSTAELERKQFSDHRSELVGVGGVAWCL
jgi:hypothetical protein